jgi:hypothetical protein
MRKCLAFVLTAAATLFVAAAAPARSAFGGTVFIASNTDASTEGLGAFTGSISYDDVSTLTIKLTNTTPVGSGFITGFVFNIAGDALATLSPNPTGSFSDLRTSGASNPLEANPFGTFEAGAGLGSNGNLKFLGGGSPNDGIAVGSEQTFTFNVTGTDATSLRVIDFLSEMSSGNQNNEASFVVRFRGIDARAGSDKVPATAAVPLPPAAWSGILTLGFAGFTALKRRGLMPRGNA